jgi:hypothetical protein
VNGFYGFYPTDEENIKEYDSDMEAIEWYVFWTQSEEYDTWQDELARLYHLEESDSDSDSDSYPYFHDTDEYYG